MTDIFMTVLNMSVTAAFVIAVLCLARLALAKMLAPKWVSYALWAVAGFRLAAPFTFEGAFSLLPFADKPVPPTAIIENVSPVGALVAGGDAIADALNGGLGTVTIRLDAPAVNGMQPSTEAYHSQVWLTLFQYVWLIGIVAMTLYAVVSYVRLLRRKDNVTTPFVYGFIKPKIHIPSGLAGEELRYVTLHEQTHVKRRDHLVKLFAFALLCVHWFNPFAWLAFVLLCADMEMSCDERVMRELGMDAKAEYSQALLSLSMNRRILAASPLAFGEGGIKERVKNVLNFRKPTRLVIIAAVLLAVGLTAGLAVNRADAKSAPVQATISYDGKSATIALGNSDKIPYVELGSTISLNFKDGRPAAIIVIEIYANADGSRRYNEPTDRILDVALSGGNLATFAVTENPAVGLSSNLDDYKSGNSFRWYRIICGEGSDAVEYGLWVRTDPRFLMNAESTVDIDALAALRTPYVGNNSAVGKIIDALPPLNNAHKQQFFSIGDDYGTGFAPYTLTIYYEYMGADKTAARDMTYEPKTAALLFALIDNLEEISFAFRDTPSDGGLDKNAYTSRLTIGKEQTTEYIANIGLDWEDFRNDFDAATENLFAQPAPVDEVAPGTSVATDAKVIIDNGTGRVSADGGQSWMDGEMYRQSQPAQADIAWWTYDEYKEWLDEQKKTLPGVIGGMGGYYDERGVLHSEVWTQEKVDEAIAMYEQILEDIGNGAKVSKFLVDGNETTDIGYTLNPSAPPSAAAYGAEFSLRDGSVVDLGSFATEKERLAAVRAFCDEQVKDGKMTRQEAEKIQSEYK
jgi:beta-lactamase regulating signal transducer with metallopeptidase domain